MPSEPTQRDARDAELAARREAEQEARRGLDAAVLAYGMATACGLGSGIYDAEREAQRSLDRYRDAVAARVKAELLQSGTLVLVDHDGDHVHFYLPLPNGRRRHFAAVSAVDVPAIPCQITSEPGTCVEARVVLVPEATHGR